VSTRGADREGEKNISRSREKGKRTAGTRRENQKTEFRLQSKGEREGVKRKSAIRRSRSLSHKNLLGKIEGRGEIERGVTDIQKRIVVRNPCIRGPHARQNFKESQDANTEIETEREENRGGDKNRAKNGCRPL